MTAGTIEDIYKLSPVQHGILVHCLAHPAAGLYFEQFSWSFDRALDLAAFRRAWALVQAQHPILRSAFFWKELDEPLQVVRRRVPLPLRLLDWRALTPEQQQQQWAALLAADRREGFGLTAPPLMRLTLIQRAADDYQCLWSYHHLLLDGWSVGLLLQDVFHAYDALCRGQGMTLPPRRPYRDYIAWLRQQDLDAAEAFWRQQLAEVTAPTRLWIERRSGEAALEAETHAERQRMLSASLTQALHALAQRHRVTLTVLLQGAWALLLRSYSGSNTVVFGLTVGGRPPDLPGSEAMVGLFINTLPVRVLVPPALPLPDWLADLHAQQVALRQYEYSPLVAVQGWSAVPRGTPLFESILVVENYRPMSRTRKVEVNQRTNYPLTVVVEPGPQVRLRIGYQAARFAEAAVEQMLRHLVTVLTGMVAQPEARIGAIALLTTAEQTELVQRWRGRESPVLGAPVHDRVAAQAAARPDALALAASDAQLTYAALNGRANQLAHRLRRLGVGPETRVGVCLERDAGLVVALLAVLKAGGAYVPLDPTYPPDRQAFILEDSQARVLITSRGEAGGWGLEAGSESPVSSLQSPVSRAVVDLRAEWPAIAQDPRTDPAGWTCAENLAYVIYTSGSTGTPKGVLVTHANLARLFAATQEWFHFDDGDTWTLFHSAAFDFSVWELWGALCYGGRLVVVPYWVSRSPEAFHDLLRDERVTVLNQTPSAFRQLIRAEEQVVRTAGMSLRLVIFGGEALERAILAPWFARHGDQAPRLVNMYGITETTVHVTYRPITAGDLAGASGSVIGQPIPDLEAYLLDDQFRPVPIGVPGELYVGGAGVARGYLDRPDLTAERFIPDPFTSIYDERRRTKDEDTPSSFVLRPSSGTRLYKTGDRARYLANGEFEYLGRIDQQVKIRGFRIELGEIEAALAQHPNVQECVVVAWADDAERTRLVAYVVALEDPEPSPVELHAFLQTKLPAYMLPATFVPIFALPLTPNGKLDRRALPAPDLASFARADFVAPRTPQEEVLTSIFAAVLGVRQVGIHDHFFALGGHSLLATQVISRVRRAFEIDLPLRSLFEHPTVAELSERIATFRRDARDVPSLALRPVDRTGTLPLSFAQQRLWFLTQLEPDGSAYNIPVAVRMRGSLDVSALRWSLEQIVHRHEALRTTFAAVDGQPAQVIVPASRGAATAPLLPLLDLRGLPYAARQGAARGLALAEAQRPFDLARGPLLRAALLRLADDEHTLLLTMHHIVSDGWSMGVLVHELVGLYALFGSETRPPLPPLPIQYADYAVWQRAWLQGAVLEEQLAYWTRQLANLTVLELSLDRPRPRVLSFGAAYQRFSLPPGLCDRLVALSQREGGTLFMLLLAAFQVLLARYSGQDDIAIGTPIANRTHRETEPLIGFFANTLVLRTSLAGDPALREALERAREVCLGAYAHQDLPFEQVVEALQPERDLQRHPLFQVMFMLQNAPMAAPALPGLSLEPLAIPNIATKFDLSLSLMEDAGSLVGTFEYRADLFGPNAIMRLAGHFRVLLEAIAAQPDLRVSELPLLAAAERQQLLVEWNAIGDRGQGTGDRSVHQLFAEQAVRSPNAVAIVFDGSTTDDRRATTDDQQSTFSVQRSAFSVQQLTYGELNRRANQLARHLRALGVQPEVPIGIFVERSPELIIGLLGILKAGGAYLPLDPAYPAERLAFMLEDSQARVLITQRSIYDLRFTIYDLDESQAEIVNRKSKIVNIDADWPIIARLPATNPDSGVTADQLAYVIYTSGSTGAPKGVLGCHRGTVNRFRWMWTALPFAAGEVCCQKTALSFVDSVWELFGPLLQGVRVVLIPDEVLKDPRRLVRTLALHDVTRIVLVPALLHAMLEMVADLRGQLPRLQYWISSGEPLSAELCRRFREQLPQSTLLNLYGSSEVAADATWFDTRSHSGDTSVPIGRPIANLRVYVLDRWGQPAPIGVPGELYVGGVGLARGYLHRPDLTAERFVPNPFARGQGSGVRDQESEVRSQKANDQRPTTNDENDHLVTLSPCHLVTEGGKRLYRTGDLARYCADGSVEYLGRRDHQVKLRGVRVELGEIEAVLRRHPAVREAAVLARANAPSAQGYADTRLVAYIVPTTDDRRPTTDQRPPTTDQRSQDKETEREGEEAASTLLVSLSPPLVSQAPSFVSGLRDYLKQKLPEYMLPAAFVVLDAFPMLPSGKVDRGALPALDLGQPLADDGFAAPRTPTEALLAGIWATVLGVPQVGVHDNFFHQGGHSLLATRVIARLSQAFDVDLPLHSLFEAPTVADLARLVDSALRTAPERHLPLRPVPRAGPLPLSFAQQRLWFLDQLDPDSAAYHMPIAVRLWGALDRPALGQSLDALVRRHEALRTTFVAVDGQPEQVIHPAQPLTLPLLELQALPASAREATAYRLTTAEIHRPFDLARGPLIRAALLRLAADEHILLVTTHHMVSDGWSQGLLVRELAILYEALAQRRPALLPDLPLHYADYAVWQREWLQGEVLEDQLAYWTGQLAQLPALALPTDHPRPALQTFRGARAAINIPPPLTTALRELSRHEGVTLFMTLLAGFQLVLARYTGQADIAVGTPIAGRNHVAVEGVVGYFANTLVLRTNLAGALSVRALLGRVRAVALGAYSHQDVPFEQLVEVLQPARDLSANPLFQVLFALQNVPLPSFHLPGLTLSPLELDRQVARFDLSLDLWEGPEQLSGWFEYSTDLFEAATITRMAGQLRTVLEAMAADLAQPVATLPLLTAPERQQLLVEWNDTWREVRSQNSEFRRSQLVPDLLASDSWLLTPGSWCIHEVFAAQAERTPDAVAVVFETTNDQRPTTDDRRPTTDDIQDKETRGQGDKEIQGHRRDNRAVFSVQPPRGYPAFSVQHLTYAALNQRANQLAQRLRALGVAPEVPVGIALARTLELPLAILGVLKAGGAYVPLDPNYPAERIAFMLEDARVALLITRGGEAGGWALEAESDSPVPSLQSPVSRAVVDLRADWPIIARQPATNPDSGVTADQLAYVIYTSGSTGRPKGVMVEHRGVVNLLRVTQPLLRFGASDAWTLVHSHAFDLSVWELFGPLLCGGCLVVVPTEVTQTPAALLDLLIRQRVTVLNQTPAALRALLEVLGADAARAGQLSLRRLMCGGEALAPELLAPALAMGVPLWNFYGPTEATVWTTTQHVDRADRGPGAVAIGRPLGNTTIYLLDAQLQPVPIGVPGELYIGGVQLAHGYLNRPELTAERFIPNPFGTTTDQRPPTNDQADKETSRQGDKERDATIDSSSFILHPSSFRLYKTGDLARYQPDGSIAFLGRIDQQVKLRGYRIELGEIEALLAAHPSVREAAVLLRADVPGEQRLVAYVVPTTDDRRPTTNDQAVPSSFRVPSGRGTSSSESEPSSFSVQRSAFSAELRSFLREQLPGYMVPAAFVVMDELPLGPNRKVNRGALPAPEEISSVTDDADAAPQTPIEELLAGIWAQLLGLKQVELHDNFFELGGHSLLATQVLARIQATFGVELPVRSLFDDPTVAGLAARLAAAQPAAELPPLRPVARDHDLPLSFAQQRLWFLGQLAPTSPAYNLPAALRLRGPIDVAALAHSFGVLVQRHEILRTTFALRGGQPVQRIAPRTALALPLLDLQGLPATTRAAVSQQLATAEAWRPFDLARGPLLRATILRLETREHILLLTLHHIVADGWSMGVLVREVTALYAALRRAEPPALPALPIQYADYAVWQREWLAGAARESQLDYWRQQLADLPVLDLPLDRPRPSMATVAGARQPLVFGADLRAALRALSQQEGVTLFMVLLGLFQVLLAQWSGQDDIVVGTDVANRPQLALEGLIGFFVNQLVLRTALSGDPTFQELLAQVRGVCLGAYAHQEVPFEQVVAEVQPERRLDRTPLFQVKLILQNAPLDALTAAELEVEPVAIGARAVPFDLVLSLQETAAGIVGSVDYRLDLFDRATIIWLVRGLEALARAAVEAPQARLSALRNTLAHAPTGREQEPEQDQDFIGRRRQRLAEARRKLIVDTAAGGD